LKRLITYDAKTKTITLNKAEGSYTSKFSKVKLVMVGFEDVSKTIKVGGKKATSGSERFSYLSAISKFDPITAAGKVDDIAAQTVVFDNTKDEVKVQW